MRRTRTHVRLLAVAVAAVFGATGCVAGTLTGGGGEGSLSAIDLDGASLRPGAKEFTEQAILGEITRLALLEAGADVAPTTSVTGSTNVRLAMESNRIDLYWEYTGTGWSTHLQREIGDAPRAEDDLFAAVREADAQNNIVWLDPAPLNNAYAVAIAAATGEELGLATLSDWAGLAQQDPVQAGMCAAAEFITRDDGLPGIESTYGVELPPEAVAEVELSLIPGLTAAGEDCLVGEVTITDGAVAANDLVILEDDQDALIDYNAAVTVRRDVLDEYPQLAELFAPISAALTSEVARGLNERADIGGELPEEVAADWMREQGFIS